MKNTILLILLTAAMFLAVYFYRQQSVAKDALQTTDARLTELTETVTEQKRELDSLRQLVPAPDTMLLVPPGGAEFVDELGSLSESDIKRLKRRGLGSPEVELQNDLQRKQTSLLPVKGSMGGTMRIRDTRILNDRYALAYFEDGHNGGYMLLRYEVNNGNISWRVLDHYTM